MHQIYVAPNWFIGYDIAFEFIFFLVTLIVSIRAYKVYKLTDQRQPRIFSTAFSFLAASYLIQAFLNIMVLTEFNEAIDQATELLTISQINILGMLIHIFLFAAAIVTLTYMTFNTKKASPLMLLSGLMFAGLALGKDLLLAFNVLSTILLLYILSYYFFNFMRNKNKQTFIVMIAFLLLFISGIHLILAVNNSLDYALAHIFTLASYVLIMINLFLVVKHEQKKKPA